MGQEQAAFTTLDDTLTIGTPQVTVLFLWYQGWNLGPCTGKASTLPLSHTSISSHHSLLGVRMLCPASHLSTPLSQQVYCTEDVS